MFKRKAKLSDKMRVTYTRGMMHIFGVIDSNKGIISFGYGDERKLEKGKHGQRFRIADRVYSIEDYLCLEYDEFRGYIRDRNFESASYDEFKKIVYKDMSRVKLYNSDLTVEYKIELGDNYIGSDYIMIKRDKEKGVRMSLKDIYFEVCSGRMVLE